MPRDQLIQDVTVVDYVVAKTDLGVIGVKNAVISMMDLLVTDVSQIIMGSQIAHVRLILLLTFNLFRSNSIHVLDCDCDPNGSKSLQCDDNGNCQCKEGLNISTDPEDGGKCDSCIQDYYGFPNCKGK